MVGYRVGDFETGGILPRDRVARGGSDVNKINSTKMGNWTEVERTAGLMGSGEYEEVRGRECSG